MRILLAYVASIPLAALAQGDRASVTGVVQDPAGAYIPGVRLVVQTDSSHFTGTSDDTGAYEFRDLPPAEYRLIASMAGFLAKTVKLSLSPGERRSQQIRLDLGIANCGATACCEVGSIARTISGTITDGRGRRIPHAIVSAYAYRAAPQRIMAAPDGSFLFERMPCGLVLVAVEVDRYRVAEREIPQGCESVNWDFILAKSKR